MRNWHLSRRELLRQLGLGAACLPILRASQTYGQDPLFPKRVFIHLQTEGYRMPKWLPEDGPLAGQILPESTAPLQEHIDDLIFMANLGNPIFPGCDRWGHGTYGTIFCGGAYDEDSGNGKEYWEPTVPTPDQVIGQALLERHPELSPPASLAMEVRVGGGGFLGAKRCFWAGAKQPITPDPDPYNAYAQLFADRGTGTDPEVARLFAEKKSLLDFVGKDLERFQAQLGTEDRLVIGGHLQAIRDIETQLSGSAIIGECPTVFSGDPGNPIDIDANENVPQLLMLNFELMVQALKCDAKRVVTSQFGDATGGRIIFDFVEGVPRDGNGYQQFRDWHDLGHRPVRPGGEDDKATVDRWCMERFSELLTMMKEIPEGDGNMLDNTAVLFANHMEDGEDHGAIRLPWILAGKCGGYFDTGKCIADAGKPFMGVLAEICHAMDVEIPAEVGGPDAWGDSDAFEEMPELRA